MAKKSQAVRDVDWNDPCGRVRWLVEKHYEGNRSSFAAAIGVSHTAIANIVSGKKSPGRKLLTAIAERLAVNSAWLLTGQGEPFVGSNPGPPKGVPVSVNLLPGKPADHMPLLAGRWLDDAEKLFTATQYWLMLDSEHGVFRDLRLGFRSGDKILIETDAAKFPAKDALSDHLCVLRVAVEATSLVLGLVRYTPDSRESYERLSAYLYGDRSARTEPVEHPSDYAVREPDPKIQYEDIVGIWMRLIRR